MDFNAYLTHCVMAEGAFSPEECHRIIHTEGLLQSALVRNTAPESTALVEDKTVRSAKLKPILDTPENAWLMQKLMYICTAANEQYFCFAWRALSSLQVIEYSVGDFYDWHLDIGKLDNSSRKFSLVVLLSDPQDYEGGQLTLWDNQPAQKQGSVYLFPSYLMHKVQPVTKGVRYSLVAWATGPCFT